jgi:hypothetical protein
MSDPTPGIKFLFRYRDLSADTLPSHTEIIKKEGSCWWGWWKRPTESGRAEIWEALESEIKSNGSALVGLFDSGSGVVHTAKIVEVRRPNLENDQAVPVVLSKEELPLIPSYYRESRHSRGWMKITEISTTLDFFGKHSYVASPPLPQYSETQLARLKNKRIADADELRAMDTTIWEVRRSVASDSSGNFIVARLGLETPISSHAVECNGEWILHISDLHYGVGANRDRHRWRLESETGSPRQTLADVIALTLESAQRRVGAIVVTGDLTYDGSKSEFDEAQKGLRKLVDGSLQLSSDHLVIVPGNHDIRWANTTVYEENAKVGVASEEATKYYREFFESLFNYAPNQNLSMARRFQFPGGTLVDVIAVNSSSLETGASFLAGMGRVQEAAFQEAANALSWHIPGVALRMLCLHHHLALTENLENVNEYSTGFGIAIDAPRTLRLAAKNRVHLALHGHKHRAFVWRSSAYELPEHTEESWNLGSINILGGGSVGVTGTEGERNFFNLVRYSSGKVEVEMYRSTSAGVFSKFITWEAPIVFNDKGESLIEPWRKVGAREPNQ